MSADIDRIRQRHKAVDRSVWVASDGIEAHEDRGVLLAEVDRLTAALAEARDDYDAACRAIGCPLRGGTSTDGGAA